MADDFRVTVVLEDGSGEGFGERLSEYEHELEDEARKSLGEAVAVSLAQYGIPYAKGFAFGIGLQLIEASVGIGIGTVFLAREGISFATLRDLESEEEREEAEAVEPEPDRTPALRDSG